MSNWTSPTLSVAIHGFLNFVQENAETVSLRNHDYLLWFLCCNPTIKSLTATQHTHKHTHTHTHTHTHGPVRSEFYDIRHLRDQRDAGYPTFPDIRTSHLTWILTVPGKLMGRINRLSVDNLPSSSTALHAPLPFHHYWSNTMYILV